MATNDVPGANPANADQLSMGCWAEHEDGSMIFVKNTENDQVVYELYDMSRTEPTYWQDAMRAEAFKQMFSYTPTGASKEKWTWHDKTPFPWDRVIRKFERPLPQYADVHATLSAAARVAESLRLKKQQLFKEDVEARTERVVAGAAPIIDRLQQAIDALPKGKERKRLKRAKEVLQQLTATEAAEE